MPKGEIMNEQQRLADIQNLLQYVKGVLDTPARQDVAAILDDIGHMTLGLVENLKALDTSINTTQKEAFDSHTKQIADTSQTIMEKLNAVQQTIQHTDTSNQEGITQIQTLYQEYKELSEQCMRTYAQQEMATTETLDALCKDSKQTSMQLQEIQKVLIDKEYLNAFADKFAKTVDNLTRQNDIADAQTQKNMHQITTCMNETTSALSEIGNQLHTIEDGFQTSIGRLNIIDIKLDTITEVVTEHEPK